MGAGIKHAGIALLFLYGGIEVYNGRISIGDFTIINTYFQMIFSAITFFLNFGKSYQSALVAFDRITEIMDIVEEENGDIALNEVNSILLKNITFSYDKERTIINKFSYKFEKSYIYGIVGGNGAGKSILANIILGMEQDYEGYVYYDSIDLKKLDIIDLRANLLGVSEQEPVLMNGTIKDNLCLYNEDSIEEEKIFSYLNEMYLREIIDKYPKGLDTIIDEKNLIISGGEKQKFSLVKTFLKDSNVIILDEPTSVLDIKTINKLKEILLNMKKGKIIIIISHDNRILEIADKIIKMNDYLDYDTNIKTKNAI